MVTLSIPDRLLWFVYPFKLGVAAAVAVTSLGLLPASLPKDGLSAGFVAMMCVQPTVTGGLKEAVSQLLGSLAGALIGSLLLALGPVAAGPLALAIFLTASLVLWRRASFGTLAVALFSALYMYQMPVEPQLVAGPVRMIAVFVGVVSGVLVTLLLGPWYYGSMLGARLRQGGRDLAQAFRTGLERTRAGEEPAAFDILHGDLVAWRQEAGAFRQEWSWWRAGRQAAAAERFSAYEAALRHLEMAGHYGLDLLRVRDADHEQVLPRVAAALERMATGDREAAANWPELPDAPSADAERTTLVACTRYMGHHVRAATKAMASGNPA
ncbi:MAG: FUSC family protein [Candidatus Sericytochromatia bacterium]|nr:FUSC family protein [Candidatus Sericytochromatia bacterium]